MAVRGKSIMQFVFSCESNLKNITALNFLAHIFLSFGHEQISIGNFIADSVKGKSQESFSKEIQQGIALHRAIDSFTDSHPLYRRSCKRIFKVHGHYSRVIIDIFYDYFLAKNWPAYHPQPLAQFAAAFYTLLEIEFDRLPPKTQHLLPYMKKQNWLVAYGSLSGIDGILKGMHRRTSFNSKMDLAVNELAAFEKELEGDFKEFFKELIIFSKNKLAVIRA